VQKYKKNGFHNKIFEKITAFFKVLSINVHGAFADKLKNDFAYEIFAYNFAVLKTLR